MNWGVIIMKIKWFILSCFNHVHYPVNKKKFKCHVNSKIKKQKEKLVMRKEKLVQEVGVISSDISEITWQGYQYPKEKIGCIVCEAKVTHNE